MKRLAPLVVFLALPAMGIAWEQRSTSGVDRPITFAKDVAPILYRQCVPCHQPDGPAPFSLITFDEVRRHAAQIAAATARRYMPPWKPEPGGAEFVGERRLSDPEIATIGRWASGGRLEGDASDLPAPPRVSSGWPLGEPDVVVRLPEYTLRADGNDVFRNFVVAAARAAGSDTVSDPVSDPGSDTVSEAGSDPVSDTVQNRVRGSVLGSHYVRALDFHPGSRAVHHANIRVDPTPASRRLDEADPEPGYEGIILRSADYPDGHFLGWTPGQIPSSGRNALAWRLGAGDDLVVQLHLQPTGKTERIAPAIGIYFADGPPARTPSMLRLGRQNLDIPPGADEFRVTDTYVLPVEAEIRAIQPHAHYRARLVSASAILPGGARRSLILIKQWDFNWQDQYQYAAPFWLPASTTLEMAYVFDNSDANPRNPVHPPGRVSWGWRSSDEMADVWIQVMTRTESDRARLNADVRHKMAVEDAIGCETLIARQPDHAALRNDAASLYLELGRAADALRHFDAVARLQPRSAPAHYNVGVALEASGRPGEAERQYETAVQLDPAYSLAHNNLGSLRLAGGRVNEARRQFERAVATGAENAEAHNNLGAVRLALGEAAASIPYLERAVRLRAVYPEAHFNLARAYASTDKMDAAIREGTRAESQAREAGKTDLLARIQEQLRAYRAGVKK